MNRLKLNTMESCVLSAQEMNHIKGAEWKGGCGCGCKYVNNGGSDSVDNAGANDALGINPGLDTIQTLPDAVIIATKPNN